MNPLTQIKNTRKATAAEVRLNLSDSASWHAKFKHSAYIFAGGLDFDLTEGDLLAVFAQYGEVVDVNLCRDRVTGKSRGFAFIAYEDQRSTVLSVDNLSGARVSGRIIRVEHVDNYKKKRAEMEGEDQSTISDDEPPAPQPSSKHDRMQKHPQVA
ncbi:RNA binding protein [Haematococcus lacustris]